jgi:hypothetical protein
VTFTPARVEDVTLERVPIMEPLAITGMVSPVYVAVADWAEHDGSD